MPVWKVTQEGNFCRSSNSGKKIDKVLPTHQHLNEEVVVIRGSVGIQAPSKLEFLKKCTGGSISIIKEDRL